MTRIRAAIFSLSAAVMLASQPAAAAPATRSMGALPATGLNSVQFMQRTKAACTVDCSQWAAKAKKKRGGYDPGGASAGGRFPIFFLLGPLALAAAIAAAAGASGGNHDSPG